MPTPEQAALLATDRWRWLADVLDRWYAEPLTAADGSTPEEIAATGTVLPTVLAEWFTLVGNRLRPVQDAPATPKDLDEDGAVVVWTENQGCWAIRVDGPGDDPVCVLDDDAYPFTPARLTATLHGMLLGDTLVGAWSGHRIGPLGRLAPGVRGGFAKDATDAETAAVEAAYAPLPVAGNPFSGEAPRADAAAIVRCGHWLEWMTADDASFARIGALVDLDPAGGEHEVVLAFEGASPERRRLVESAEGFADHPRFAEAVGARGHLGMAVCGADDVRFHVTTRHPEETARALLAAVPRQLAEHAVLAVRPARISVFRVVHPEERAEYVPPG